MYSLKKTGFEAYKLYLALKSHFTSKTYDYFKYNGTTRAKFESFDQRNDKYFFTKLAKKKDAVGFLVSLFVYGKKDMWIGDIVKNEEIDELYLKRQKIKESMSYVFSNDLDKLDQDFLKNIKVVDGQHPYLLNLLLGEHINIETFIILNDLIKFVPYWNKHIEDQAIWPEVRLKCKKYQPFMEYNKDKCLKIFVDKFGPLAA